MRIIKPSYEILTDLNQNYLKLIELAGRTCYKSEDKITENSSREFAKMLMSRGHYSVIEHGYFSVRFIVSRGFTHELVRHRLASYSQESTRYCNYTKDKFGHITFIVPEELESDIEFGITDSMNLLTSLVYVQSNNQYLKPFEEWLFAMASSEIRYFNMIEQKISPQIARGVLPIDLKTEIIVTANLREWNHIFNLRTSKAAHPQMRQLMIPLLQEVQQKIPVLYDNIEI